MGRQNSTRGRQKSGEQKKVTIKNGSLRELDRGPKIYARGWHFFSIRHRREDEQNLWSNLNNTTYKLI